MGNLCGYNQDWLDRYRQIYPESLRANGDVLGSARGYQRAEDDAAPPELTYENWPSSFWGGFLASGGHVSELGLPAPFLDLAANGHHATGRWWGGSATGYATTQRWSELDLAGQAPYVLCPAGQEGDGCPYVDAIVCPGGAPIDVGIPLPFLADDDPHGYKLPSYIDYATRIVTTSPNGTNMIYQFNYNGITKPDGSIYRLVAYPADYYCDVYATEAVLRRQGVGYIVDPRLPSFLSDSAT